ncbi:MAG: twin-arginine translocase TatA/TatE family subunit [Anaerolineae bacterium]|nr:twin-arginine translocase TatA/TatE family subunit [Anaerolineae bacterium]
MNFLGVGPFELLLILVIATVVLGPERMAQAGRTLGRLYAQYQHRWKKDVDEMTRELRKELADLQQELDEIRQVAESEVETTQAELQELVDEKKKIKIDLDAPNGEGQREAKTDGHQAAPLAAAETGEEAQ